ncbi:hypothetical protein PG999_004141 [Apiospora kogelbergensis]|uniref:AB hydrolase-1 domain-containing protein n=1 Tax=Apiospora kogelbergensis TaxID=1337665 RepID=A0AAW0R5E1_9PEZI
MASSKPIILLAHGAWHPPLMYDLLKQELNDLGYTFLCPELKTGNGGGQARRDLESRQTNATQSCRTPLRAGQRDRHHGPLLRRDTSLRCYRRQWSSRAGCGRQEGGFRRIIYLAGFAIPQRGMTLLQTFGGEWAPWHDAVIPNPTNQLITVNEKTKEALFNDLPEEEQDAYLAKLVPHSQDAMETPVDFVVTDITIPKTYIICEMDQGLPASLQERLVETVPGFQVARIWASHSPFLSKPNECAELIAKIAADECFSSDEAARRRV